MKYAIKTFFLSLFVFCFPYSDFCQSPFSSISTTNLCSEKYMSVLTLSFSKALCCSFILSAENAFNSGIMTDCSFFGIKLI